MVTLFIKDGLVKLIEEGQLTTTDKVDFDTVQQTEAGLFEENDEFDLKVIEFSNYREEYNNIKSFLSGKVDNFDSRLIVFCLTAYNVTQGINKFRLFDYTGKYNIKTDYESGEVIEAYKYRDNYVFDPENIDTDYFAWSVNLETGEKIDSYKAIDNKIHKNDIAYLTKGTFEDMPTELQTQCANLDFKDKIRSWSIKDNGDLIVEY